MKEINIEFVDNGFVIRVTSNGVQSIYDNTKVYVAKDKDELIKKLKEIL